MIRSILNEWDNLCGILSEMEEDHRFNSIDKHLLIELQSLLEPFHDASLDFQTRCRPTLHLVRLWKDQLTSVLAVNQNDSASIKELKEIGISYMEKKWELHSIHNIAVFLHPQIKSRNFSKNEKAQVLSMLKDEIGKNCSREISPKSSKKRTLELEALTSRKRQKVSIIHAFADKNNDEEDEISRYMTMSVFCAENEELDLNEWWKNHEEKFPKLFKIFQKLLCVPASTASSEGQFSLANFMVSSHRNNLNSSKIDDILFLKSSFDEKSI